MATTTTTTSIDTSSVTSEQIDRCARIIGPDSNVFYLVLSESDDETEYAVRYTDHHFTCTCKAGQYGFVGCRKGVCKHVIWAVAAAKEFKQLTQVGEVSHPIVTEVEHFLADERKAGWTIGTCGHRVAVGREWDDCGCRAY